jgi:hypothetical protein
MKMKQKSIDENEAKNPLIKVEQKILDKHLIEALNYVFL